MNAKESQRSNGVVSWKFSRSMQTAENKSTLQNMSLNIDQKGSIKRKKHEIKNRGGKRKGESHELRTASLFNQVTSIKQVSNQ